MRRVAVFFFFDIEGVVDDYVVYLLERIKPFIERLLIICNGKLNDLGQKKLNAFSEELIIRPNRGFDVWAYKEAIEYIGWQSLESYNELILFNSTIYGPFFPFEEMFGEMDKESVDFWGITKYHRMEFDPIGIIVYRYMPEHLQSHFIAIRKSMFTSQYFREYWTHMRPINSYNEAVGYHEAIFTKKFSDLGFTWKVYVETKDLEKITNYPLMFQPLDMLKNRRCPILKRKLFFLDYQMVINEGSGLLAPEVIKFIRESTDYDTELIYQNLIRTQRPDIFNHNLHSTYLIPESVNHEESAVIQAKLAIILIINDITFLQTFVEQFQRLKGLNIDIYIYSTMTERVTAIDENIQANLKSFKVHLSHVNDTISGLLDFLVRFGQNYDLVLFMKTKADEKVSFLSSEKANYDLQLSNLAGNYNCVYEISELFRKEPSLGIICSPYPRFGEERYGLDLNWQHCKEELIEVLQELGLDENLIHDDIPCVNSRIAFWFRPRSLETLRSWSNRTEDNNKTLNRLTMSEDVFFYSLGFIAKKSGFFVGTGMNWDTARTTITNLEIIVRQKKTVRWAIKEWLKEYYPALLKKIIPIYQRIRCLVFQK
jgi:rhamnosyltransferase